VKVCCISSLEEARLAVAAGVDALGLVSVMPGGRGAIADELIAKVAAAVPPSVATFLLTSLVRVDQLVEQVRHVATTTVQLCARLEAGSHAELRAALPDVAIVQTIHVDGRASVAEALSIAPHVDALLLESGNPELELEELDGTARTHDWALSAEIRGSVRTPVFLAGGLHAGNVRAALEQVEPWGVDVCTGIRSEGRLDRQKLGTFLQACGRRPLPARTAELSER
jgi:phosphoribosylanthranilate isomerase